MWSVVDRRDIGSWLEGPGSRTGDPTAYPGQRLGMPRSGPGSIGRFGRRLVAVVIDWTLAQLVAHAIFAVPVGTAGPHSFVPLAIFAAENLLLVGTLGSTIGHRLLGLQVRDLTGGVARPLQVLVRTALLCLFLPAMFWDRDGRGLHDRAAQTVIVRV
jgi:uncharacterized RDD family membrane protein YckC